jgi:HJR/Mrr/RecB family endonuclease
MRLWGSRHPAMTWLLVAVSVLFLLTGKTSGVVIGLIGLATAYQLFGRPRLKQRARNQSRLAAMPSRPDPRSQPMPPAVRRTSTDATAAVAIQRLTVLPTPSQIAIVNQLEPDEEPELVLLGAYRDAIVATDRRLFVIPDGRSGHERLWAASYESLTNAQIEQQRNGARLLISSQQSPNLTPIVRLSGHAQVQSAINAVQQIRRQIAAARQTLGEKGTPSGQLAFIETANRSISSSSYRSGLSLGDMLEMDPTAFEEFTGRALESLGYTNVRRVGGSGDLAADLTATDPQGRSAIVQCKRYTPGSKVGSPALQAFIGMKEVHHKVDRGIFVTTADYSQEAINLAKAHNIVLIDGDDLVKIAALVLTPPSIPANEETGNSVQYCPNCRAIVEEGGKFCSNCGVGLSGSTSR